MLDELMEAKRAELLAACRSELPHADGAQRLEQCVTDVFEELARAWKRHAQHEGALTSPASEPVGARVVGASVLMSRVRIAINRLAQRSRAPVLVRGDAGTGRRHCARALHLETYPDGEFFELAEPERLNELERRLAVLRAGGGSALAPGLTVYVRNLFDSPPKIQEKVARLLSERSLALRIVVSSYQPLAPPTLRQMRLGPDLLRAFNELELPALVEREGDVRELARHLARLASIRTGASEIRFSEGALARLERHSWPENVVELSALVERLSRERAGELIHADELSELDARASGSVFRLPPAGLDLAALERELLSQALAMSGNNQTRAAALLGLTRDQIRYRLAKFEIGALAQGAD